MISLFGGFKLMYFAFPEITTVVVVVTEVVDTGLRHLIITPVDLAEDTKDMTDQNLDHILLVSILFN